MATLQKNIGSVRRNGCSKRPNITSKGDAVVPV